jgi:8-oxo-dGTP pyrophosphatase MutT (NUDIX family)
VKAAPSSSPPLEVPLRTRIAELLRDTTPGQEPEVPFGGKLGVELLAHVQRLIPARLARAAVLVPLVERESGLNVLLTLRASHLRHHAGQVSFPGGRIEPGDAGPWEAALREAREEIGLDPSRVERAGYLRDHLVITGFRVTPVVAFVRPGFELALDCSEVDDVFEVPLEYVLDTANHRARDRHFSGFTVLTWEILYEGRQIWGATANMLLTLARLVRGDTR